MSNTEQSKEVPINEFHIINTHNGYRVETMPRAGETAEQYKNRHLKNKDTAYRIKNKSQD